MLFNSYQFLFVFLPVVLLGYAFMGRFVGGRSPLVWLTLSSFTFYGVWNPPFLLLLLGSISINYSIGHAMQKGARKRQFFILGIVFNLALLGYFKYANFFCRAVEFFLCRTVGLVGGCASLSNIFFLPFSRLLI